MNILEDRTQSDLAETVSEWLSPHSFPSSPASEIWQRLRQALYDGRLDAHALNEQTGNLVHIPCNFWGSNEADRIYESSRIVSYATDLEYQGRILIKKRDLEDFSAGRAKAGLGGPPTQGMVILAPSDPETVSAYLPLGYLGIREAHNALVDAKKAFRREPKNYPDMMKYKQDIYQQAAGDLAEFLGSGRLLAYHRQLSAGTIRALRPVDWRPGGALRESVIKLSRTAGGWPTTATISADDETVAGHVVVRAEDFVKILRGDESNNSTVEDSRSNQYSDIQIKTGGRPVVHDAEAFIVEAFRIAFLDGAPNTQAEFIEQTARAYQDKRRAVNGSAKTPGETWMKERIRPVWRIIEESRKRR